MTEDEDEVEDEVEDETEDERQPVVSSLRRQAKLLRYAIPHWRAIVLLTATMFIDIGLDLARPWPLKLLVDNVLGHRATPRILTSLLPAAGTRHGLLVWCAVGTVLIFVLGTTSSTFYNYFSLRIGQRMVFELASDLFAHLQRLSLLFHTRRPLGDTIQRVTGDSYCVSTLVTDALIPVVQALVMLVVMFVIMWQLESTLTLVALGVLPFLAVVIRYLANPIKDRARESRDYEGKLTSVVEQTLGAVPAVQAFTREHIEEQRFRHYADRTVGAYLRSTLAGIWFEWFSGIVTTLGTAGIIYLGGDLAIRGKLTAGTIIVFLSYLGSLYDPLDSVTSTAQTIQGAAAEADRVMEVLEIEPAVTDQPGATEARVAGPIRYEDVSFGYEPDRPALEHVSLEVKPGEVLAIVGETGAGKTTLANMLVRFYDPWEGRITIGGTDIRAFKYRSLRQQIALVLQDPFIFPMTIRENIAYGRPDASEEEIRAAAEAANAHDFITRLPDGYETDVGERGATLSGGEKQRLSIARAFLKDAPILILDEPTSALDARTESLLLDALERLMRGRITFIIAHRLSTTRQASQIVVLHHGRLVESGTHEELLDLGGRYADLYGRQTYVRERPEPEGSGAGRE
ncbi:MAG TPA: ABC transporter ATP-binding protein [Solirubrobacteraceae bacterium]|nr:ABC transporter ATP-binding protein [Solirubrobacteraceae bacterium]